METKLNLAEKLEAARKAALTPAPQKPDVSHETLAAGDVYIVGETKVKADGKVYGPGDEFILSQDILDNGRAGVLISHGFLIEKGKWERSRSKMAKRKHFLNVIAPKEAALNTEKTEYMKAQARMAEAESLLRAAKDAAAVAFSRVELATKELESVLDDEIAL